MSLGSAVALHDTLFDGVDNRRIGCCTGLEIETQTCGLHRLGGGLSETSYHNLALIEVGEIFHEGVDAGRREEDEHIIVKGLIGSEIVAHRAIHHSLGVVQADIVKHIGAGIGVNVTNGIEEFFLAVAGHAGLKLGIVELTGSTEKDLALAIYYIFLEIVGYLLGGAEILHCVGDGDSHLLAEAEEMIYRRLGRKHDGGKIVDVDFLLSELLGCQTFYLDKRTEDHLYVIATRKLVETVVGRFWL